MRTGRNPIRHRVHAGWSWLPYAALALMLFFSRGVNAQVTEWETRGGQSIEAELRRLSLDGKVILRKPDGQLVTTWLTQLSDESIEFIRETGGDIGKMLAYEEDLEPVEYLGFQLGMSRRQGLDRIRGKLEFGRGPTPPVLSSSPVTWVGDIEERTETWTRQGNARFPEAEMTSLTFRYGRLVRVTIRFRVEPEAKGESKLFEALLSKLQDRFGEFSATSTLDLDADEVWQGMSGHALILLYRKVDDTTGQDVITGTAIHRDLDLLADRAELQEIKQSLADF